MRGDFILQRPQGFVSDATHLFLPLKGKWYDQFASGQKREELRLYGPRWNEKTCHPGRNVLLSRGYGTKNRMWGNIWQFKKQHGSTFGRTYKNAILEIYGKLDVWIACFQIEIKQNDPGTPPGQPLAGPATHIANNPSAATYLEG